MDQTAGMLDEDVQEKGYALLCVAQPQSDCTVQTIEEVRTWCSNRIFARECSAAVNAAVHNWQQMSASATKALGSHFTIEYTHGVCDMHLDPLFAWHFHNLPVCCRTTHMHYNSSCQTIPCTPRHSHLYQPNWTCHGLQEELLAEVMHSGAL